MPEPHPVRDTAVTALAVAGVSAVALEELAGLEALGQLTAALLVCAYAVLGARVAFVAAKVLTLARPRL